MTSYLKKLWSLSPRDDGLRVTSVALASQILIAPLRLGVLAIKNETQSRKDAKSQSIKPASVAPPNDQLRHRRADGANLKLQGQSLALTPVASSGWFGDVFILQKSLVSLSQRRRTLSNVRRTRLANPLCASAPWRLSDKK